MNRQGKALYWLAAGVVALAGGREWMRRRRKIDLAHKVVLLAGASRGLGLNIAREIGQQGARTAICARDAEELQRAQEILAGQNVDVDTFVCDITDKAQCEKLVSDVQKKLGPIDVLVNIAAIMQIGPGELMSQKDYEDAMQTNFWGPFYVIQAVLPQMRARRSGRILNVTSFGGKIAMPHMLPYTASKFAITGFSKGLRAEVAKDGIIVSTVYPTLMRTGSLYRAFFKGSNRTEFAMGAIASSIPLFSMSAERAARETVACLKRGDAEAVLSRRAQLGLSFGVLFPGLTTDLLAFATRFLPDGKGPDSTGTQLVEGRDSTSSLAPSTLTTPNDEAARKNNEMPPESTRPA
jgi:NAD(P)-dependent dehydrogenase (short-subunit alcohol dehydrogenase family)